MWLVSCVVPGPLRMVVFRVLCVLLICLPFYTCLTSTIPEDSFENIKNNNLEQLVVFYRGSDPETTKILRTIEKTVPKIRAVVPHFAFARCDGDKPENVAAFKDAQFNSGVFIFTSTPVEGIIKYTLPITVKEIVQYVTLKYLPYNESDVLQFTSEDDFFDRMDLSETPRPIFVKFYETWCQHCKRLKPTFSRGATFFKDRVDFLEIECSHNEESQAFCARNDVHSFPVLMLFTGEQKMKYEDENRNIGSFQMFFKKHIEGYKMVKKYKTEKKKSTDDDEDQVVPPKTLAVEDAEPIASATPTPTSTPTPTPTSSDDTSPKKKKSKKKQRKVESSDDEEDEEAAALARAARRKAKREAAERAAAEALAKKNSRKNNKVEDGEDVKIEDIPVKQEPVQQQDKKKKIKKKQDKTRKATSESTPIEELDLSSVGEFSLPPEDDVPVPTSTCTPTSTVTSTSETTAPKDTASRLSALETSMHELKLMLQQQQALLQELATRH